MTVRIDRPIVGGSVAAPPSKSETHRALICSALAGADMPAGGSEDIEATARSLSALRRGGKLVLDCGESGSTLRFLLPVCAALGKEAAFVMRGRLPSRPLSALTDALAAHGCAIARPEDCMLICRGRLESGEYTLPGNVSSQYVSGLLLALPLLPGESAVRCEGVLESRPYVDMTVDILRRFGVEINENPDAGRGSVFVVPGNQQYSLPPDGAGIGGDWSAAAFWLASGAFGPGAVTVTGLREDTRQGDKAVATLLSAFGAQVRWDGNAVTVAHGVLQGTDIDARDTPDLVPALAAVASVAEGKTTIYGAGRLRLKESDRLRAVSECLTALGANISETEDGLVIEGKRRLIGGVIGSFGDHRIAMTAAVLSRVCEKPVAIVGAEAVNKSYPRFFDDFAALGGAYRWISHSEES
ncbi:MAG: 3-phosphoshikimate 1-carboxyvinyltransferase [Oscillospiraceae bacterium]|nr:3-phosphoshikimate 1-carboxyvinyltransferase [Oscillospiraceae bacterium]